MNAESFQTVVAGYSNGSASLSELRMESSEIWNNILLNPAKAAQAAGILGIQVEELKKLHELPFDLQSGRAGIAGVDIAILVFTWIGTDVVLGAIRDMAKDELKKRLRQLWKEIFEPALKEKLDRDALGPESRDDSMN